MCFGRMDMTTNNSDRSGIRTMDVFRFAPELFEVRINVMERLGEEGLDWLSHRSAVLANRTHGLAQCC